MKYFLIFLIPLIFTGCLEARKAGNQNRLIIKKVTTGLKNTYPDNPYWKQVDDEAKDNLENPPTVLNGAGGAIIDAAQAGNQIGSAWYGAGIAGIIALALKAAEAFINAKSKSVAKEIEHEADKLIPADHHATWDDAVKVATVKVLTKKKGIT